MTALLSTLLLCAFFLPQLVFAESATNFSPRELYRSSRDGAIINIVPGMEEARIVPAKGDAETGINATPGEKIENLSSKSSDWREPSQRSEEIYVQAISQWLAGMEPGQRSRARAILHEAHPVTYSLRVAIRDKKAQLAAMSFGKDTRPETLPMLGQELQALRNSLRAELQKLGDRLKKEAGVRMGPLGGDGFWLAPQPDTGGVTGMEDKSGDKTVAQNPASV